MPAVLAATFLLLAFADLCPAQSGCSILDKSKKAQFITYDSYGDFTGVRLRLTNNTSCRITVQTDDVAPLRFVKLHDGKTRMEVFTDSRDGAILRLHYLTQNRRRWLEPERGYGWGDSVSTYDIAPGHSVFFPVRPRSLKERLDIVVPFTYAWESNGPIGFGAGGVTHRIHFLIEELPAEAVRIIKKLR